MTQTGNKDKPRQKNIYKNDIDKPRQKCTDKRNYENDIDLPIYIYTKAKTPGQKKKKK